MKKKFNLYKVEWCEYVLERTHAKAAARSLKRIQDPGGVTLSFYVRVDGCDHGKVIHFRGTKTGQQPSQCRLPL